MNDIAAFLGENPVVIAMIASLGITTILFTALAVIMTRAGVSLRPLVFVGGMLAIVAVPQFAFHLAQSFEVIPKRDLTWTFGEDVPGTTSWREREEVLQVGNDAFADPVAVFGSEVDPNLVANLLTPGVVTPFSGAEIARMAVIPPTRTTTVARFSDASDARRAARDYMTLAAGFVPDPGPDGSYTFRRPGGDAARVLVAGRTVFVFSADTETQLDTAIGASRALERATSSSSDSMQSETDDFWLYRPWVLVTLLLILVLVYVVAAFKGAAWAGTVPAAPETTPTSPDELRKRILAINELDVPFAIREEPEGGRIVVTWRYADAKWADLARARGLRRTHRLLLDLDPTRRAVRVRDQFSRLDWSAGRDGASVRWTGGLGIVFFEVDHRQVLGLQVDENGRFTLSNHEYRFNLQEMKAPFIETARTSGWNWRPTLWRGPRWLRWLTD